jgi:hypothetical protein
MAAGPGVNPITSDFFDVIIIKSLRAFEEVCLPRGSHLQVRYAISPFPPLIIKPVETQESGT